jgi:hypothetical protein
VENTPLQTKQTDNIKKDELSSSVESEDDKAKRLWNSAYDNLKEENNNMVTTYEEALTKLAFEDEAFKNSIKFENFNNADKAEHPPNMFKCKPDKRMELMHSVTELVLDKTKKHEKVREFFSTTAEVIDNVKEPIASALINYPPAGLAFSGLCASLPVSLVSDYPSIFVKRISFSLSHYCKPRPWPMVSSTFLNSSISGLHYQSHY